MRPTRWRHTTHVVLAVAVIALVAVVVAVAAVLTRGGDTSGAQALPAHSLVTANPGVIPVSESAAVPTAAGMTATLAVPVADPNLGNVSGRVTDAQTGKQLWEHRSGVPLLPASTNKVLTTGAALLALDRDERVTTTVVAADQTGQPGVVVLVGGGDPILSAAPAGQQTWYRGAARISDLAEQVRKSGVVATAVQVDDSLYSGPDFAPGWDPADIDGGDIAPIQSVMIDAGRIQPTTVDSARSRTPALDAGRALATALGLDPAKVTMAPNPPSGRQLAVRAIGNADRTVAADDERLRQRDGRGDRPGGGQGDWPAGELRRSRRSGDQQACRHRTSTSTGVTLFDSSGLSVLDRLTAKTLDGVVNAAAGPDQPSMRPLLDLLPIAGGSGTLSDRFLGGDPRTPSAGWLRAKTGSLTAVNSLAGVVTDDSGRVLTFAFISNDAGPKGRVALDNLAAPCAPADVVREQLVRADRRSALSTGRSRATSAPAGPARPGVHRLHPRPSRRRAGHRRPQGRRPGS